MKSRTRLTSGQRAELVADYAAGMPVKAIAAKYCVHRGTIPTLVKRAGGRLRLPGLSDADRVRASALYATGMTLDAVAGQLAVGPKTVRDAVVADGLSVRPPGRRSRL
ncbi:helix-turn-helix domain-containing protein [Leucobacter luti]|uniref:helix-turn-helix domain-containing protein n=1 Tax=Leucobacter luti TaxID=340320 RepID=UPI00105CBD11|nr:helix-turn-helix domain-containing protein [Leucobacter luti]